MTDLPTTATTTTTTTTTKRTIDAVGGKYPRPTGECDRCRERLILCWGPIIIRPYWRHRSNTSECKISAKCAESETHRIAKQMLARYADRGGIVDFSKECPTCGKTERGSLPICPETQICEECGFDRDGRGFRWDVAGKCDDGRIIWGVEVKFSHPTSEDGIRARNASGAVWIEVDAIEVVRMLDVKNRPSSIELRDVSIKNPCQSCRSQISTTITLQPDAVISLPQAGPPCPTANVATPSESCRAEFVDQKSPTETSIRDERNCGVPMKYIAFVLGYLRSLEETHDEHRWQIRGAPENESDAVVAWGIFLRRSVCMRCETRSSVTRARPFCSTCFEKIVADEEIEKRGESHLADRQTAAVEEPRPTEFTRETTDEPRRADQQIVAVEELRLTEPASKTSDESRCVDQSTTPFEEPHPAEHIGTASDRGSMERIAVALGYLESDYSCLAKQLVDDAVRGKHRVRWTTWGEPRDSREAAIAWKGLIKKGKCQRCHERRRVIFGRPFFFSCYKEISAQEEEDEGDWVTVNPERKAALRRSFYWLIHVPEWNRYGRHSTCACGFDGIDSNQRLQKYYEPGSGFVDRYVWWFGMLRSICTMCLEKERVARGIF